MVLFDVGICFDRFDEVLLVYCVDLLFESVGGLLKRSIFEGVEYGIEVFLRGWFI